MKELTQNEIASVNGGGFSYGELAGEMVGGCVIAVGGAAAATGGLSFAAAGQICGAGAIFGGGSYLIKSCWAKWMSK